MFAVHSGSWRVQNTSLLLKKMRLIHSFEMAITTWNPNQQVFSMDVGWFPHISYVRTWNHPIDTTINIWLFRLPGKHSWIKWQWKFRNAVWDETIKALKSWHPRTFQTTAMEVVFFSGFFWGRHDFPSTTNRIRTQNSKRTPHDKKTHTQLIRYHVNRIPSHNGRKYEHLASWWFQPIWKTLAKFDHFPR